MELIRAEVKIRMRSKLVPALIQAAMVYHTRRGLRTWCDCEYCSAHRRGTGYVGHNTFKARDDYLVADTGGVRYLPSHLWIRMNDGPYWYDHWEDYIRSGIARERRRKVVQLRKELQEIKERVL